MNREFNLAGAIYGQILVTSVIAAYSEGDDTDAGTILIGVGATMVVFWAAHIFSALVAERVHQAGDLDREQVARAVAAEWPMLQAALPALIVLALGAFDALSVDHAVEYAIGLGVAQLVVWGLIIARRSKLPPLKATFAVLLTAGFGLAIVALKVLVH